MTLPARLADLLNLARLFIFPPGVDGAPLPGHPESTTRTLPRCQEEWLALVDLELWPEEAT